MAAAPTFTPGLNAGQTYASFNTTVTVTLAAAGGGVIYYTLDESDPRDDGAVYSTGIVLTESTTIKAVNVASNAISPVVQQDFVIAG